MPARPPIAFCVPVGPSAPGARIGGKARSLLALRAAGLPVPPAFAVTTDLFAALRREGPPLPAGLDAPGALAAIEAAARALRAAPWPDGFLDQLRVQLAGLGGGSRLSVRSSAETEDDPSALAAGLYQSCVGIDASDVERALREVLATALSPAVVAYAGARGRAADSLAMAALIHPFVAGQASGTAALEAAAGARAVVEARGPVTPAVRAHLEAALATLVARHGSVEVEWVAEGDAPLFLQLRPFRPGAARRAAAGDPEWRWDAAHNPLPLSPAQAGLVAFVDARGAVPFAQRVIDGYLFTRPRPHPAPPPADPRAALTSLQQSAAARLARPEPLEAALETFAALYEPLFAVVQPAARAAREALRARLSEAGLPAGSLLPELLSDVASAASARRDAAARIAAAGTDADRAAARAAYAAQFGDEAPLWDLAAPTWREAPDAIAGVAPPSRPPGAARTPSLAARLRDSLPPEDRQPWDALLAAAREAAAVAEDDDAFYARAQAHVRRALLREGERLASAGVLARAADIFWLPLELVRRAARGEDALTRAEADRLLDEARAADARARAAPPALHPDPDGSEAGLVRGCRGSPGARVGIVRHWPLPRQPERTDPPVVVARTILPTELPLISAAALVVETGGVLDHVAAQARERGIPAVVGAAGALDALADGDRVLVDGDAGLVIRLGGPS